MPLRWASCLFRPTRSTTTSLEVNPNACPPELQEQLTLRGTACLRPRGSHILYERVDDAGQDAFTPPVVIYIKRLAVCGGLDVCIKRTLVTHFVCRAAREARLQVQLQHPHLLPALASVRGRHHYYLVLPAAEADLWAEVETMRQQGTGYSEEDLREIARQILLGLEHLHSSNLAHRDIKPANVLRMPDGRVVVADFGCADACMSGFVAAGTAQFQPPECRRNAGAQLAVLAKGYDQRMQDMWSVGATLASLWFAQLPEVIRGTGSSRVPGAAAAAAAVAATAASRFGSTVGNTGDVAAAGVCSAAAAGDESSGSSNGDASTPLAPIKPPLMLPPFLAAAGFGACALTVGARGEPMSEQLLDLLSRLLRIRPSERLTVTQALGHEWMLADKQVSTSTANPVPIAAAEAEATEANLPPWPPEDADTSVGERFMPFIPHLQVVLHSTTSSPPVTLLTPRMSTALAAAGPMPEVEGRGGVRMERLIQDSPPTQQQLLLRVQREQEPCRTCFGASPSSPSHPPPIAAATNAVTASSPSNRSSPSDTATQHSDGSRQQPHIYQKGRSGSPPSVLGHCHSHDGSSPLSQATRSPDEEAELFASRQRQRQQLQRQQLQEQQQQQGSPSSWLMRPSPSAHAHIPKRATQRAILRVFVGAGGSRAAVEEREGTGKGRGVRRNGGRFWSSQHDSQFWFLRPRFPVPTRGKRHHSCPSFSLAHLRDDARTCFTVPCQ
ncbi:hypothetical protein VaNZ11_006258 [Volvox africanus]|uniref:Protein kinase domain-containing protein n=1 Tax=Volvox africanus TaxID=51714 RepID=A0ABQ5S1X9_9CHLO|nr:hypothetical protein VaNZ11_006258 [Volvox africanus]